MGFLHKSQAPTFPPVHGGTAYNFEEAATSFIEGGAGGAPFRCMRVSTRGVVYMKRVRVMPAEKRSLDTELRDGMNKRSGNKRTSNGMVVVQFMIGKKDILIERSSDDLTVGLHQLRISFCRVLSTWNFVWVAFGKDDRLLGNRSTRTRGRTFAETGIAT